MSISLKANIRCEDCGRKEDILLESAGTRGFCDGGFSINFEIQWKAVGADDWMGLISGTYCPKCYLIKKSLVPKKKSLIEKIFG